MEEAEAKTSKYNSGIAQIYRLDNLWKDVNRHSREGKYLLWNEDLDRIWSELARDLKETEFKLKEKEINELDSIIANVQPFKDGGSGFNPTTKEDNTKRNEQYKALMKKELFLRRLENFVGKGTAWEDEEEDNW